MTWFMVLAQDSQPGDPAMAAQRQALRPQHLARLQALHEAGRVITAGALLLEADRPEAGMSGSLLVLQFDDRATLDVWLADEPYLKAGIYQGFDVRPMRVAFPTQ